MFHHGPSLPGWGWALLLPRLPAEKPLENLSAPIGDWALSVENGMEKSGGALLGSNEVVTAIQLPCSPCLCCLLSQRHQR